MTSGREGGPGGPGRDALAAVRALRGRRLLLWVLLLAAAGARAITLEERAGSAARGVVAGLSWADLAGVALFAIAVAPLVVRAADALRARRGG